MRVADYIFEFVASKGVKHVFVLPGGGAMYLVDALGQNPDLTFVPQHHEHAVSIAAEGYSRVSEHLGVGLVTTGPGSLNAICGVGGAFIESVPLMMISGQVKRSDMVGDTGLRQRGVQEVDIVKIVEPITKYAVTVLDAADIRYELEKAYYYGTSGRQGPVWLDIPLDIQAAPFEGEEGLRSFTPTNDDKAVNDIASDIESIYGLINQAERPIILAGHGIRLAGAAKEFRQLYERLEIPVVTTWNAMDLIPFDHPLCMGKPGSVALRAPNFAVQNSDLMISIGARLDNVITAHSPERFARQAKKIVVDIDPAEIDKHNMVIDISVVSDAAEFVTAMLAKSNAAMAIDRTPWHDRCAQWKKKYTVLDGRDIKGDSEKISHYHFVQTLSDAVPPDMQVVTGSSGLGVEVFYTTFEAKKGQRIFLTSGLGAMGYGLPHAIGACIAGGSRPIVCVESDGSMQLNIQELNTLHGLDLPIRLFIMNNNGYASIRNTQRNYFDSRFVATGPEANLSMPDIVEVAKAFGIPAVRIDNKDTMADQIAEVLSHRGPIVCDVVLVENEILQPKVTALPQEDGSIISMPLEDMSPLLSREELEEAMIIPLLPESLSINVPSD